MMITDEMKQLIIKSKTFREYLKCFKTETYEQMANRMNENRAPHQLEVTKYKVTRVMTDMPTTHQLRILAQISEHCFNMHISELMWPLQKIAPTQRVSFKEMRTKGVLEFRTSTYIRDRTKEHFIQSDAV